MAKYYVGMLFDVESPVSEDIFHESTSAPPLRSLKEDFERAIWLDGPPDGLGPSLDKTPGPDSVDGDVLLFFPSSEPAMVYGLRAFAKLSDAIGSRNRFSTGSLTPPVWNSVGFEPDHRLSGGDFKLVVELMVVDVAKIVSDLDINDDAKREVVGALDEWGEAISSLPTIDNPEAFSETATAASNFARTAIEKTGPGAAVVGRALWAISKHPLVSIPLGGALLYWATGSPDNVININVDLGTGPGG